MLKYFIFFLFTTLFISCKSKPEQYYIKGKLINICDNTPVIGERVEMFQKGIGGTITAYKKGISLYTFTNNNGEFEIIYDAYHKTPFTFMDVSTYLPIENLDLGDIPFQSSSTIVYKINANNSYSNTDTLWFSNINNNLLTNMIIGPFNDVVIGTHMVDSHNSLQYNESSKKIEVIDSLNYFYASYKLKTSGSNFVLQQRKYLKKCNNIADTLTIEIN